MPQKAALFANMKSRRGLEWFGDAVKKLEESGVELVDTEAFDDPKAISPAVERAVKNKVPIVIVGGGDGTFSANAKHFVGSESVLGVLPLGTGNAFARDLGIRAEVDAACDVIVNGRELAVDLGRAGDDYFVNVVTVGLTVQIAEELKNYDKKRFGRLVYAFALFRALRHAKPFKCMLSTDTERHQLETIQVVIGSGRFHAGPFPIAPDASIVDGKLNIYALRATTPMGILKFALKLPGGHHVELLDVPAWAATGGRLETTPRQAVNIDGEVGEHSPLRFSIAPGALRVMAPQDFDPSA